jgi:hypothetical protein
MVLPLTKQVKTNISFGAQPWNLVNPRGPLQPIQRIFLKNWKKFTKNVGVSD